MTEASAPSAPAESNGEEDRDRGRLSRQAKKIANYHVLLAGAMEDMFHETGSGSGTDDPDGQNDAAPASAHPAPKKALRVFDLPPEFRQQPSCYVPGCTGRFDRYRPDLKPTLWIRTCLSHSRPRIGPGACTICSDANSNVFAWSNDGVTKVNLCTGCSTRLEPQLNHFSFEQVGAAESGPRKGQQTVEEGGLTFTFSDAPDKPADSAEKPHPPSRSKSSHSPPPLRALKSAPESAPKKRRTNSIGGTIAGPDDEYKDRSIAASVLPPPMPTQRHEAPKPVPSLLNRAAPAPERMDPAARMQTCINSCRVWENKGSLSVGMIDFVVDAYYTSDPAAAIQAVILQGMADHTSMHWVNYTLQRWREMPKGAK